MGQFKPMVKMATTEPSVELKLKKGGAVEKKMMDGGALGAAMPSAGGMPARGGMMPTKKPMRPPLAARRKAMAVPPMASTPPAMKKGGKADAMEALEKHADKPASKAHKGLKTGGVAKSPKPGNYATGGVVNGQGGYKAGGIINTEKQGGAYRNTKMHTAPVDHDSAPTGEVKLGKPGGYKKGGSAKKAYATGGLVDTGKPVAMPKKAASKPVSISKLSGTFKKGGKVQKYNSGGEVEDLSKGAYDASIGPSKEEMDLAQTMRSIPSKIYRGAKKLMGLGTPSAKERKIIEQDTKPKTGEPAKKRGGAMKC